MNSSLRVGAFLKFLSTHSVRSATTTMQLTVFTTAEFLSTHSVRSATWMDFIRNNRIEFLSTHSVRSATIFETTTDALFTNFYPRTP